MTAEISSYSITVAANFSDILYYADQQCLVGQPARHGKSNSY
jgi:hypothetical protein